MKDHTDRKTYTTKNIFIQNYLKSTKFNVRPLFIEFVNK